MLYMYNWPNAEAGGGVIGAIVKKRGVKMKKG